MDSTDEPDEFRALTRGDLVRKLMAAKSAIGKMAERAASAEAEADQLRRHMVSVTSAAAAAEGRARSRSWGAAGMQLGVPGGGVYAEGGGAASKEAAGGGATELAATSAHGATGGVSASGAVLLPATPLTGRRAISSPSPSPSPSE